jgi:pimeloyl-ACP methyl ester carboxylesterase
MRRRQALQTAALLLAAPGLTSVASEAAAKPEAPRPRVSGIPFPFLETGERTTLFYRDWGSGDTVVVFVHGWPLNSAMWDYQMLHLAKAGMRVIAYDQRGCGRSTDPGSGYDFDTLANDLASLIEQLQLRKVVLVGHSIGCGQIVRYVSRHGAARVAGMVLLSASLPYIQQNAHNPADNPDGLDPYHFESVRHQIATDYPKWLGRAVQRSFVPETSPEMEQWALRMCLENSILAMTETSHIDVETDFRAELPQIKVRTLVVHGDADLTCKIDTTGRRVAQLIPGAALNAYAGASHVLFLTQMERFNQDLLSFIRS